MINFENDTLRLSINKIGAKITGLIFKPLGSQIVFRPKKEFEKLIPQKGDFFDERYAWGGDICVPSVAATEYSKNDLTLNVDDHGNFWTLPFQVKRHTDNSAILEAATDHFKLSVEFTLNGNELFRKYEVTNITKYKLPFTFADHLLLPINKNLSAREYINFSDDEKFEVEYSFQNKLGHKGEQINWPVDRNRPFADKLYTKLSTSENGKYCISTFLKQNSERIHIRLSSDKLDILGYWHTEGGWKNQFNYGLEFTNTNADDLVESIKKKELWWIEPGKSMNWCIEMRLST